ncbi:hypothetical protein [Roseburia faecis]|uniref:hypothetical protein n=1 Tax=Roseburia faecis TaxID=301302 RepID=UPI003F984F5D
MNKIKISDSDKKLLVIFFAIVLVAGSYFFIFNKGMKKAADIEEQNAKNRATVQQMEQMEARLPQVKKNIQALQEKQKKIIADYPSDMTTEKVIETLQAMEDENASNFHISEITFLMNTPVSVATDGTAADSTSTDTSSTDTSSTEMSSQTDTQDTQSMDDSSEADNESAKQVEGYYASIGVKFTADYIGLKDMILFTNQFKDRMTITNFDVNSDSETGGVSGQMTINMYYLTNTGKDYVPPVFENMSNGKNNIFGGSAE